MKQMKKWLAACMAFVMVLTFAPAEVVNAAQSAWKVMVYDNSVLDSIYFIAEDANKNYFVGYKDNKVVITDDQMKLVKETNCNSIRNGVFTCKENNQKGYIVSDLPRYHYDDSNAKYGMIKLDGSVILDLKYTYDQMVELTDLPGITSSDDLDKLKPSKEQYVKTWLQNKGYTVKNISTYTDFKGCWNVEDGSYISLKCVECNYRIETKNGYTASGTYYFVCDATDKVLWQGRSYSSYPHNGASYYIADNGDVMQYDYWTKSAKKLFSVDDTNLASMDDNYYWWDDDDEDDWDDEDDLDYEEKPENDVHCLCLNLGSEDGILHGYGDVNGKDKKFVCLTNNKQYNEFCNQCVYISDEGLGLYNSLKSKLVEFSKADLGGEIQSKKVLTTRRCFLYQKGENQYLLYDYETDKKVTINTTENIKDCGGYYRFNDVVYLLKESDWWYEDDDQGTLMPAEVYKVSLNDGKISKISLEYDTVEEILCVNGKVILTAGYWDEENGSLSKYHRVIMDENGKILTSLVSTNRDIYCEFNILANKYIAVGNSKLLDLNFKEVGEITGFSEDYRGDYVGEQNSVFALSVKLNSGKNQLMICDSGKMIYQKDVVGSLASSDIVGQWIYDDFADVICCEMNIDIAKGRIQCTDTLIDLSTGEELYQNAYEQKINIVYEDGEEYEEYETDKGVEIYAYPYSAKKQIIVICDGEVSGTISQGTVGETGNNNTTTDKPSQNPSGGISTPGTQTTPETVAPTSISKNGIDYKVSDSSVILVNISSKCKKASTVKIPASVSVDGKSYNVVAIDDNVFKNCKSLKSVTIGKNVKTIGKNAFSGCKKLNKITVKGKLTKVGKKAFKNISKNVKVTLPKKNFDKVKKAMIKAGVNKKATFKKK